MFKEVHLEQKEGWQSKGATIAVQTNPFLEQREHDSMTLPSNRITATTWAWQLVKDRDVLTGGIISHLVQMDLNKKGGTVPLIDNLEIMEVFKDEDKEKEASVIDLIR